MLEEIRAKIAEILNISEEEVLPESNLIADLKADSMDIATLLLELEDQYNIEIEEEDLDSLKVVKDIVTYLENKQ